MNVFEAVKQSVTTRQAAEHYGIHVNKGGMCVCPFHNDKNPSMKADRRFYCFGCGATGDVIDFVSRLYGVGCRDAALMLAQDFPSLMKMGGMPQSVRKSRVCGGKQMKKSSGAWSGGVSGHCLIITICCASGRENMPRASKMKHGTRVLWRRCRI